MEITLEKIELVKDRTGVSYKEAKDALEAAEGSVVDAIIAIEETVDEKPAKKVNEAANETVDKIKEVVKKGNISKITIKKDDDVLLNLPLNAGIVGALVAPWGVIAGVIAAFGFKCVIEVVKTDGTIIDVSDAVTDAVGTVAEKSSGFMSEFKEKSAEYYEKGKEKAEEVVDKAADKIKIDEEEFDFSECFEEDEDDDEESEAGSGRDGRDSGVCTFCRCKAFRTPRRSVASPDAQGRRRPHRPG